MFSPSWNRSRLAIRTWNNFSAVFLSKLEAENEFYHNHTRRTIPQTPTCVRGPWVQRICAGTLSSTTKETTLKWYLIDHDPIRFEFWVSERMKRTLVRIGARTQRNVDFIWSSIRWLRDGREGVRLCGEGETTIRNCNCNANVRCVSI